MPYIEEKNQRELFRKTIEEQLIGPGSDIFGFPPEEELISSSPRHNYYAGMLFSSAFLDNNRLFAINEDGKEDNDDDNTIIITKEDGGTPGDNGDETTSPGKDSPTPAGHVYSSTFPMHCGLTFCVAEGTDKVTIEVSYGKYDKSESRKIKLSHEE